MGPSLQLTCFWPKSPSFNSFISPYQIKNVIRLQFNLRICLHNQNILNQSNQCLFQFFGPWPSDRSTWNLQSILWIVYLCKCLRLVKLYLLLLIRFTVLWYSYLFSILLVYLVHLLNKGVTILWKIHQGSRQKLLHFLQHNHIALSYSQHQTTHHKISQQAQHSQQP